MMSNYRNHLPIEVPIYEIDNTNAENFEHSEVIEHAIYLARRLQTNEIWWGIDEGRQAVEQALEKCAALLWADASTGK